MEVELEQENAILQCLLTDIPDKDRKVRIGLIFPIRNLEKEAEEKEEEEDRLTLSIPIAKRQKSLVGDVVKKEKAKKLIKKEVKKEVKRKVKEEIKEEIGNEVEGDSILLPTLSELQDSVRIDDKESSLRFSKRKR
jgi:hypothetical protein